MDITERIRKILYELKLIKQDDYLIKTVYLFGSFAKGKYNEKSDIDLAFVFDKRFYKEDPFKALQEAELLGVKISNIINRAVDVIVLNSSSLSFAYNTIRQGICVYESSSADRILYEVAVDNKYQDFMPFIKELRDIKRRALIGRD